MGSRRRALELLLTAPACGARVARPDGGEGTVRAGHVVEGSGMLLVEWDDGRTELVVAAHVKRVVADADGQ